MKRIFALLLIGLSLLCFFTACKDKAQKDTTSSNTSGLSSKETEAWGNVKIETEGSSAGGVGSDVSDISSGTKDNSDSSVTSSSDASSKYDPSKENGFENWVPVS